MKIKYYFFILNFCTIFLFSSCSKDYLFNKNEAIISSELKKIKNSDQTARNFSFLVDNKYNIKTFESVCDSLSSAGVKDFSIYDFSKLPTEISQLNKLSELQRENYYSDKNSARDLIDYIDDFNRNKLYRIIDKFGYPSYYNRKWSDTTNLRVGITFVLTHVDSHSNFGKKMLRLMLKEYSKGRVSEGEMKHYLWDVDGRNGFPYDYVIEFDKWKKRANAK